jgi:PII-like signaling protein
MSKNAKLLLIFLDETDVWEDLPLYESIVRRLLQHGISGATVHTGIMGYGIQQRVHHKRLFGISDDRPVTISVVEEDAKLRPFLSEIRDMVDDSLMVMLDVEVLN